MRETLGICVIYADNDAVLMIAMTSLSFRPRTAIPISISLRCTTLHTATRKWRVDLPIIRKTLSSRGATHSVSAPLPRRDQKYMYHAKYPPDLLKIARASALFIIVSFE